MQNPAYRWLRRNWPEAAREVGSVLVLALALATAGCTIPGGDTPADLGPGVGQPYPNLSVVPNAPPAISPESERSELLQQLEGERNTANQGAGVGSGTQLAALPAGPIAVIYFAENSSVLTDRDKAILAEVAKILIERGGSLHVIGHASLRGDGGENRSEGQKDKLAGARARAIAGDLVQEGVARSAVQSSGTGTTQPLYQEINANGIAGNRRAEIFLGS